MSMESEDRARDLVIWWMENKNRIPTTNLQKRLDFVTKGMDCALEVIAIMLKDIQELEQRHGRSQLWLPKSVSLDDNNAVKLR